MISRFLVLAVAVSTAPAFAQEADPEAGKDLFMNHCWQCHGLDATGNGPMAEMLAIQTPDLTTLSVRNHGIFPVEAVARQIDGRDPVLAHGGDMPIFGPFLDADQFLALKLPSGQPMMTALPLANLVAYLETLQSE